jgi:lysophospholipase L1-like esterase
MTGLYIYLALIGDSDIAQWPQSLLPKVAGINECIVSGHSGATMEQILPFLREMLVSTTVKPCERKLILVVCAGENDVGENIDMSTTLSIFRQLLSKVFDNATNRSVDMTRLIFLGPKLEPWLDDDCESRKQYIHLSKRLETICKDHIHAASILFVDCLTMFCGESAKLPGALYGGRATAVAKYFTPDNLHLSNDGYIIWKEKVEEAVQVMLKTFA